MRITRRTAAALVLGAAAAPAFAAPARRPRVPTRGFALPGWLAREPQVPADATLARLKALGFATIRLPIDPAIVTSATLPRVELALAAVTDLGFNAILDLHPGGAANADQIDSAWDSLAALLATTSPDRVYAELLNEPPLAPAEWARLAARLVATIRSRAPGHTLIWGPADVQGLWQLADQSPPSDPNLIAAIHYYSPMMFTHQAENWDGSPLARIHDLPFPSSRDATAVEALAATLEPADRAFLENNFGDPWTPDGIAADFARAAAWSAAHGIPLMLGEFGVLNFAVDPVSRATWIRSVREAAEANGIGWTYWQADQGFGFIADRTSTAGFDQPIIEALLQ